MFQHGGTLTPAGNGQIIITNRNDYSIEVQRNQFVGSCSEEEERSTVNSCSSQSTSKVAGACVSALGTLEVQTSSAEGEQSSSLMSVSFDGAHIPLARPHHHQMSKHQLLTHVRQSMNSVATTSGTSSLESEQTPTNNYDPKTTPGIAGDAECEFCVGNNRRLWTILTCTMIPRTNSMSEVSVSTCNCRYQQHARLASMIFSEPRLNVVDTAQPSAEITSKTSIFRSLISSLLPSALTLVNYESTESTDYIDNLAACRKDAALRKASVADNDIDDDAVAYYNASGLSATPINKALLAELLSAPECSHTPVPNYFFEDGSVRRHLLPECIKDLKVDHDNMTCTRDEYSLLLWEVCIVPEGREDFFSDKPGLAEDFIFDMNLTDRSPWQERLTPLAPDDNMEIQKILHKNLMLELIETSRSAYACKILLVRKPSGRHQIAANLTPLNNKTRKNAYPLPLIQDNLFYLNHTVHLSSVDISGAYLSMPIPPEFRQYFAFVTHSGLYQWKVLPYGYKNSGALFCSFLDGVLANLRWQILTAYSDDILMWHGLTAKMHMKGLAVTFNRLQKAKLRVSLVKCYLFQKKLTHLGFQVSITGVQPSKANVEKLMKIVLARPSDVTAILGLSQYYRKWIANYSQIVAPLRKLNTVASRQSDYTSAPVLQAVATLKAALSSYPILRHADFNKEFILETDGSGEGFGAILMQMFDGVRCVIAYASSGLPKIKAMVKASSPILEVAAASFGITYFRVYLERRHFTLRSDASILQYIRLKKPPKIIERFVLEMQSYDFKVEHVPGRSHYGADLLSRAGSRNCAYDNHHDELVDRIYFREYLVRREPNSWLQCKHGIVFLEGDSCSHPIMPCQCSKANCLTCTRKITQICLLPECLSEAQQWFANSEVKLNEIYAKADHQEKLWEPIYTERLAHGSWKSHQANDPFYKPLLELCKLEPKHAKYFIKNQLLHIRIKGFARLCVPQSLKSAVLRNAHGILGHPGINRLTALLVSRVYWKNMLADIEDWISRCLTCKRKQVTKPIRVGFSKPRTATYGGQHLH